MRPKRSYVRCIVAPTSPQEHSMTLELQKRIRDHFKWDPHPLAFIPPEFEGLAGPAFWLTYETPDEDQYVSRLYFVNGISEVLPKVLVGTGGWISVDEVVAPISAPDLVYEHVLPGEGVFVDEHDEISDSDTVFVEYITVTLADGRELSFEANGKGKVEVWRPLMWKLPA